MSGIYELQCSFQQYDWGKHGKDSKVAEYAKVCGFNKEKGFKDDLPYAELWMGTHGSGPSYITIDKKVIALKEHVQTHVQECLGTKSKYKDLPFLFKVLSIGKALSIQAHPDKKLAEELHAKFPQIYKDDNHKPEMTVALTPFEALCGFRPVNEIKKNVLDYSELHELVGEDCAKKFVNCVESDEKESLKNFFHTMMTQPEDKVRSLVEKMVKRLKSSPNTNQLNELIVRLDSQFPGDVGCFCVFLLNYVLMKEGDALFLKANEPHAYISGDCVECMASSDNVVRSGLTPKLKDVNVLVQMLTYETLSAEKQILKGVEYGKLSRLYDPPIDEFSVVRTYLDKGQKEYFNGWNGPSILLVTQGEGLINDKHVLKGQVFFISPSTSLMIETENELKLFIAFYETIVQ